MGNAFDGLQPKLLWDTFKGITEVPRPSKKEDKIIAHVTAWAKAAGFEVVMDEVKNLLIRVPATPGLEGRPVVVLQGHLDMVCEKNNETEFDFDNQGIRVWRDGDWLKAEGTTLGADNGIGLAMAMAVAVDPDAKHGPLELLFTIDEETGLTGAQSLKPGFLQGRNLINIDSEEEGVLFVGCAGGGDTHISWTGEKKDLGRGPGFLVKVTGLTGGHSGLAIIENRANALKVLFTVLDRIPGDWGIVKVEGGDKHNAIPRQAEALIAGNDLMDKGLLEQVAAQVLEGVRQEFGTIEPDAKIIIEETTHDPMGWAGCERKTLVNLMLALPHGVTSMSRDLKGLVETSTNLARIKTLGDRVEILTSSRSSVAAALENLRRAIVAVAKMARGEAILKEAYPGWQPDMKSKLLARCVKVHEQVFGKLPEVTAIHAGLECGIIGEPYGDMEMISMGPTMHGVHSPDEKLSIQSTAKMYDYLKAVLASF